jgi:predicted RecB family nuclease
MSYPILNLDGIDAEMACRLKEAGIRTTEKLLEAAKDPKGRAALAVKVEAAEDVVLKWANLADKMRIKGLGRDYAELLRHAGVKTVRDLKHRNASRLAQAIAAANKQRGLVKSPPSEKVVARWVDEAKRLPLKITY